MSPTLRASVAASRSDQLSWLDALAAELTARGWIAHVAATSPHRAPLMFAQDGTNPAARAHILAAPDNTSGVWWYWRDTADPIAPAGPVGAAAEAVIEALTQPGQRASDPGGGRPGTVPDATSGVGPRRRGRLYEASGARRGADREAR